MKEPQTIEDILSRATQVTQRYLSFKAVVAERQKRKQELEEECKSKGYNPKNLEQEIQVLEAEKAATEKELATKLDELETLLDKNE